MQRALLSIISLWLSMDAFGPVLAAQTGQPEVRRVYSADTMEFRDDANLSWVIVDLDTNGPEFGRFGLYIYPGPDQLATGYYGVASPQQTAPGAFEFDQDVDVVIRRPTGEIPSNLTDPAPSTTESGTVHLAGTVELTHHVAALRLTADNQEVLLEAQEPTPEGAPEAVAAAVSALLDEDWPRLYRLYTIGVRAQTSESTFEAEMRSRTAPGPPLKQVSLSIEEATLGTCNGFAHYHEVALVRIRQPNGRITPTRITADTVKEAGEWRLFKMTAERLDTPS